MTDVTAQTTNARRSLSERRGHLPRQLLGTSVVVRSAGRPGPRSMQKGKRVPTAGCGALPRRARYVPVSQKCPKTLRKDLVRNGKSKIEMSPVRRVRTG